MNLDTFNGDVTPFKPDMIIAGPPCQDFSHAGKRNEDLGRGKLAVTFAEIVTAVKPKWFVMENVDRILKTRKYKTAKTSPACKGQHELLYYFSLLVAQILAAALATFNSRHSVSGSTVSTDLHVQPVLLRNGLLKRISNRHYVFNPQTVTSHTSHRQITFSMTSRSFTIQLKHARTFGNHWQLLVPLRKSKH